MRKHRTDVVSLIAGGGFLSIGAVTLATDLADPDGAYALMTQSEWLAPALLVLLGLLGLAAAVRRPGEDEPDPDVETLFE